MFEMAAAPLRQKRRGESLQRRNNGCDVCVVAAAYENRARVFLYWHTKNMEVYIMKQSTRLLSVLLALVMLFGVMAIGVEAAVRRNVVITKGNVSYDSIDDVALTTEQVATLICDALDELLLGANIYEKVDVVNIVLDLRSLDTAFKSLYDVLDHWLVTSVIIGDVYALNKNKALIKNKTRAGIGDTAMLRQFIGFLTNHADSREAISKIAYGIENGSNSLDLGALTSFLDVSKLSMLNDIPALLRGLLFDELLLRSYAYPTEDDKQFYNSTPTVYTKWDKLATKPFTNTDTMLNTALHNLLTTPQDKEWVYNESTGLMERKYDLDSVILPTIEAGVININNNSLMQIIDNVLDLAFAELGVAPLNHDLKKLLMKETGADFIEVKNPSSGLIAAFEAVPNIKNYFVNAATFKYDGDWYFSDYVTRGVDANNDGVTDLDANDREITQKVRRFFKADASDVDELYNIVNWDYEFTADTYSFAAGLQTYGSLVGQLNHLLYTLMDTMLSTQMKDAIKAFNGTADFAEDGGNDKLGTNLLNIVKFVVCEYAGKIFYKNPAFVDENNEALPTFVAEVKAAANFENLAAYIAIPLMYEILPELILPVSFTKDKEIEQVAALLLREALSDLTPVLNFDDRIFKAGTLTSATGRELAELTKDEWRTLVLDMGMNLGVIYLDNVTNLNLDSAAAAAIYAANGWRGLLEEVVDWGIQYLGTGTNGILNGFGPQTLGAVRGTYNGNAFTNINKILNALLPLGMVVGCNRNGFACDIEYLAFEKIVPAIFDLDIPTLLSVFGRSGSADNLLTAKNAVATILDLVRRILNSLLPNAVPTSHLTNLNTFISQAGLKALIKSLLASLDSRVYSGGSTNGILYSGILPLISKFVSDWSGEQTVGSPLIEIENTFDATNGALSGGTFTVTNGAKGLWRGYLDENGTRQQDEHYKYRITGVTATSTAGNVTVTAPATTLDFGQGTNISFNATGVPAAGAVVLFAINYKIYDENGEFMGGDKTFTAYKYAYISYNPSNDGKETQLKVHKSDNKMQFGVFTPQYIALENGATDIPARNTVYFNVEFTNYTGYTPCKGKIDTVTPASQYGISIPTTGEIELEKETKTRWQSCTVNETQYDAANITSGTFISWNITLMMRNRKMGLSGGQADYATGTITMKFYSARDIARVKDVVNDEINTVKVQTDYNTTDVYAGRVLRTAAVSEDEPKETNFAATGVDPETGETVTIINGETAWTNYKTALNAAMRGAFQRWNDNSVYNHAELAENLRVATADINYCRKTAEQLADEGAENNDIAVIALKALYDARSSELNSYKDYMLYRFHRYEDNERDAVRLINLYEAANAVVDTKAFPYGDINMTKLNALLVKDGAYADYINALLEDRTQEQIEASALSKEKAETDYSRGYTAQTVSQITSLLERTADRLIEREGGTRTEYLATELASALAIYGKMATSAVYSEKSWNVYLDRVATAEAELLNPKNNHTVFEAKYHLQRAVNELVLIEDGADYSGLEDAIATAEAVLANHTSFKQGQDKVIGLVLAALGYKIDGTELFPGGAKDVANTAYAKDKQNRIDDAELKLRLALANVRFETTTVGGNDGATTEGQTGSDAYFAFVPANLVIDNVYGYLAAVTVPANVTNVAPVTVTPNATHAGTGTVVTFYGTLAGNTIPVASYSVVVLGDVTGDSAIDSADVLIADLVANAHKEVDGAFLKAALADSATAGAGEVTIEAVSAIVNLALGK